MTEAEPELQNLTPLKQKGGFGGNVLKLAGGTTFAQVLELLLAPILSRLYSPDAFGVLAVFGSISVIFGIIACLRYEFAIMLPEQEEDAANVLALSLALVLAITGLSAIVITVVKEPLLRLLNAPEVGPYLWLVPLSVLANGGTLALNYWNTRTKHFGRLAAVQVSASLVTNSIQLGVGALAHGNVSGLVGARVLGAVTSSAILGRRIWRDDCSLFKRAIKFRLMSEMALRYRKFPLLDMWGAVLNTISVELPVFFLSIYFNQAVVGFFGLGLRVVQLPITLVGGAISQAFFQRATEINSLNGNLASFTENVYEQLIKIGLLPAALLTLFGQDLTVFVFGAKWAEAGVFMQILALFTFFRFVSAALTILFPVFERQGTGLVAHISLFFSRVVPLVIGGWIGNARLTLGLFAGTGFVVYGVLGIWLLNLAGVKTQRAIGILLRQVIYCIPILGLLEAIKLFFNPSPLIITALCSFALCIYFTVIVLRDSTLRDIVFSIVNRFRRGQVV